MEQNNVENKINGLNKEDDNSQNAIKIDQRSVENKINNGWLRWLIMGLLIVCLIVIAVAVIIRISNKKEVDVVVVNSGTPKVEKSVSLGKMSLRADKKNVQVGDSVIVDVLMNTQSFDIVVASAAVEYDTDFLELIQVDTENSELSMEVPGEEKQGFIKVTRGEPGDSNDRDMDDGFNGSAGNLVALEFKALKKGVVKIDLLENGSEMILDDGRGSQMNVEYMGEQINIQ